MLPQLGMGMSSANIVEWAVAEGGRVEAGALLLSVETEKVVNDIPAPCSGLVRILAAAGATVAVDALIARIAETPADYACLLAAVQAPTALVPSPAPVEPTATLATPAVRAAASGLVRKLAREHGIDLAQVRGSGPDGRIVERDLAAFITPPASAPAAGAQLVTSTREKARIPLVGVRRTIAERMTAATLEAPHAHLFFEIEVSSLMAARPVRQDAAAGEGSRRVSMTALYTRALALACRAVPICNAALTGGEIIVWDEVHIGIGVALPGRGEHDSALVVPVLRHAESKSLWQIDAEIRDLVTRARAGRLSAGDMSGATVTLSSTEKMNAGQWMVGTPLLTLPQVLAFGPGAPVRRPVVAADGQLAAGYVLPCCITFDHRALDGEPAGRLAKQLTVLLGQADRLLG